MFSFGGLQLMELIRPSRAIGWVELVTCGDGRIGLGEIMGRYGEQFGMWWGNRSSIISFGERARGP